MGISDDKDGDGVFDDVPEQTKLQEFITNVADKGSNHAEEIMDEIPINPTQEVAVNREEYKITASKALSRKVWTSLGIAVCLLPFFDPLQACKD